MPSPTVKLVVAYSTNRVIGRDNTLPWHLPGDLAHFKRSTLGRPIIMGRKTWESIGRPLPGRLNLVISHNAAFKAPGASVHASLPRALAACDRQAEVCVIGGARVFDDALAFADEIIATEVHAHIEGDTFFAPLQPDQWSEVERCPQPAENGFNFDFVVYRRRRDA